MEINEIHKEIDLVQNCINRMAKNSFMLKGWLITIYTIVLTLLPEKIEFDKIFIVMISSTCLFWYLDAFFLKNEKIYREIYEWILKERPKNNRELLYQLNPNKFTTKISEVSIIKTMFSKTLLIFYGIPSVVIIYLFVMGKLQIDYNIMII